MAKVRKIPETCKKNGEKVAENLQIRKKWATFADMNENRMKYLEDELRNHSEQLDKAARCIGQLYGIVVGILIVTLLLAVRLYFIE